MACSRLIGRYRSEQGAVTWLPSSLPSVLILLSIYQRRMELHPLVSLYDVIRQYVFFGNYVRLDTHLESPYIDRHEQQGRSWQAAYYSTQHHARRVEAGFCE
jgi:hypothetical protein